MNKIRHIILGMFLVFLIALPAMSVVFAPVGISTPSSSAVIAQTHTWQTFEKNMNVTTFVSPDGSTDELWHFLNSATDSIYVEIYGINNPNILDLIHQLHDTKPSLEMKFLLGEGSLGYTSQNDYVANNLTELGYEVKWTSDVDFTYAHQKFIIIDNDTTIVHSGNWAKTSFPESDGKANREWSIAMTDTDVTAYYRSVFDGDWNNGTFYDAGTDGTGTALTYTYSTSTYPRPFATPGIFSGSMKVTPIFSHDTSLEGILYCINAAQATLDIQIPYFTNVGDAGAVDQILSAILAAKERGVTVRVISEEAYDWELVEAMFLEHDIPIVWQDTRWFTANHNKGIIVDGRIVLVSSINYSDGSITENREAGVIIEHEGIAQWYQDVYDYDWGIAGGDSLDDVNVYWEPNIPTSSSTINVTVYGHELYNDIDEVELDVKIDDGTWSNNTITANVYDSAEEDPENYFYVIP
ncbi:MAG: phosphatidylserine/phosphatidylglycerophosphate/cardiolipin synthase family protein, partial [Candidatus Thorarchaeota archaeon]